MYKHLVLVLILGLASQLYAADVATLISQGDQHFALRQSAAETQKSIDCYKQALAVEPANYEALYKLTHAYFWMGEIAPKGQKLSWYKQGEAAGKRAVQANPNGPDGHFWYGSCMGRRAEEQGIMNSLQMVGPLKDEMEKTIALTPKYSAAYYALGIIYRKAPGWPLSCGDINKAGKYAKLAVQYGPQFNYSFLGLAQVYLAQGKKDLAKQELEKAINLALEPDTIPEGNIYRAQAQALLNKMK